MPETPGVEPPASPGTTRPLLEAQMREMRQRMALMEAEKTARTLLGQILTDPWVPPATITRITESLMGRLPIVDGQLDETQLAKMAHREVTLAEQEIAEAMQAAGLGRPRDLGHAGDWTTSQPGMAAAEMDRRLEDAFVALGNSEKVAKSAAKGRD